MADARDLDDADSPWTEDPRTVLRAADGFSLTEMDRGGKPGFDGKKSDGKAFAAARGPLLAELQERLYADGRSGGSTSVLCVVQGLDTAGKGGVARHVMAMVDPQGVELASFGSPTEEELAHHYLWRIKKQLPRPGRIGVFDRSHYEDVLVARVDRLAPKKEWEPRFDEVNAFEKELVDSGTVVLKFALMVSYDEQGVRLMERLDRPDKYWKFSENDLTTRAKWDDYQRAYQDVFARTSTEHAPWYVIPADRKWYSRAAVIEILTRTLIDLDLRWPEPDWDPADMRARLAEQMSLEALETSLEETRENVRGALDDVLTTRRKSVAVDVDDQDDPVELAQAQVELAEVDVLKARWLADLAKAERQKRDLVEQARARDDG